MRRTRRSRASRARTDATHVPRKSNGATCSSFPPEMLRPHAVAARSEDAVRVDRVLDLLLQSAQRVIVVRIRIRDDVLEHGRRAILGPAVLGGELDPALERRADLAVLLGVLEHG